MKSAPRPTSSHRTYQLALAGFLLICVVMGILCFQYYRRLQKTVTNESNGYLQEVSKQIGNNVSRAIEDNFSILSTVSSVLHNSNVVDFSDVAPLLRDQQTLWNYQNILLIDQSGVAYDQSGHSVALTNDPYLQDAIVGRQRAMSASQQIGSSECIVFAIPLDGITVNGIPMSVLAGTYELSTFDQILSMSAFGGKGYCSIIQQDGTMVVRPSGGSALRSGFNLLTTLDSAEIDNGVTFDQIRQEIANGIAGIVSFTYDSVHTYMAYTPLEATTWCLLTFTPVDVVNAHSELLLQLTLLLCGAITMAFALLYVALTVTTYRHKSKLEQIAYLDPVTGGHTAQRFYEIAQSLLDAPARPSYALVYLNIEKFKILNEQFGRSACDDMLKSIQVGISQQLTEQECIGRISADNFCMLVVSSNEDSLCYQRMDLWYRSAAQCHAEQGNMWPAPIIEFGVYHVGVEPLPFPQMIDRAKLALRESSAELRGRLRCAVYDDAVRRLMVREKHLEDLMEGALEHQEFVVFLQPKYRAQTEDIGGAEALVRWKSPTEGMIYPDEFISLFEKNGFIIQLDLYVFEQVCRTIRRWLDAGLTPIKVSVNCSRVHLKLPHFLQRYVEICDRCGTPPKYLEIELTENVVFQDVALLSKTIDSIHAAGFGCSMDDFGSGYSSLNLIQDIPVDTIKLDKIFFHDASRSTARTESVVGSILTMSKALQMETVAEGVEERSHVDMLKRLGCDFIQGYYFARPMPIDEFERLAFASPIDGASE